MEGDIRGLKRDKQRIEKEIDGLKIHNINLQSELIELKNEFSKLK